MNKSLDISIVTYNSSKWIKNFFDSLINQNYKTELIKLYITDNDSTDNTYEILNDYKNKYSNLFASINIYAEQNLGFGHGHNNNFKNSNSDFILVTNIDLEFESNSILDLVNFAVSDEKDVASWEMRQKPFEHPKYYNPITLETNWSSSACVLFRKSAINEINGYEKRIFMYGEDVELSYRLRDYGYKLKYYPKATCWHYTYEEENEVKPLQFLGSTLANMYIKLRYGTLKDILFGYIYFVGLFLLPKQFKSQRKDLLRYTVKLIKNSFYFYTTRKKSEIKFNFYGFDYELTRSGAFYEYSNTEDDSSLPLVSVIVRTCNNRMDYFKQALKSILNQTYTNIEIVVVEDGTNNVESYIEKLNLSNINYESIEKSGRCIAGNIGLRNATGDFNIFLDDDDLFFADHIEVLVNEIQKTNKLVVYSNAFEVKTEVLSKEPLIYNEHSYDVIYQQEFDRGLMWQKNYIPIQSILFSRKLYLKYGGFDQELDNLEDWNLWTKYSLVDDFTYIDKTTSLYRVPYNNSVAESRQNELDSYYKKAIEKQKELKLELSVYEINQYRQNTETTYSGTLLHKIVRRFLPASYYSIVRKLYYKFKNK